VQVPLSQQVEALVSSGAYDDALVLCSLFDDRGEGSGQHRALLADIDRTHPFSSTTS
jgi:hypothetical protein